MSKVIIIGGGAAGMMAAISASENGHNVTVLEKNEKLGKKIYITGKGRCNFTNANDEDVFLENIVTNPRFLYSAFASFNNQDMMNLMERNGCKYKVERGNRVFPVSNHASDVTKALKQAMKKNGVKVRLNTEVKELCIEDEQIIGVKLADDTVLQADAVIVATGGLSYPLTGSTGDGLRFAKEAGLKVTDTRPALVAMNAEEKWCKSLKGLSLKNIAVEITKGKKNLYEDFGELTFYANGVAGPTMLSASSIVGKKLPCNLHIDLKPALSEEQIDKRLLKEFESRGNEVISSVLRAVLPAKLIPVILKQCHIDEKQKANTITKVQRNEIIGKLKDFTLTLNGLHPFSEAIITQGGVSVKEIDPKTMESKKVKGLYFAGEVLDIDALTGGYNLQIAWSTGYLAGKSI